MLQANILIYLLLPWSLSLAGWPDLSPSLYYYKEETVDQTVLHPSGVTEQRWLPSDTDQPDLTVSPPFITRLVIPPGSQHPQEEEGYWLASDAYYVVIEGSVVFGHTPGVVHDYGDLYWVMGGEVHGPVYNVGDMGCTLLITSTAQVSPRGGAEAPSDDNPSVDTSLIRERSYRQVDGGSWRNNPSPHSQACLDNGGVQNMGFNMLDNSPAALRVRWAPSCQIPYHYHPTGALYFIQYGVMMFQGDGITPDVPFYKGEVRWVRPGYAYGPEYNSDDEPMEITVLGTDTPPTFHDPPDGPYKMQKDLIVTHVFDEL